jgi:hypothetical protein
MHGSLNLKRGHIKRVRSGVTSGARMFAERIDLRSARGGRFMDLVKAYADALGGNDRIDEATRNHIRRIALLQCVLEDREAEYVKSGAISLEQTLEYQRTSNTQSRLMKRIGLFNAEKTVTGDEDDDLTPLEYMKRKSKTRREHLDDDEEED